VVFGPKDRRIDPGEVGEDNRLGTDRGGDPGASLPEKLPLDMSKAALRPIILKDSLEVTDPALGGVSEQLESLP
jgi:hypothetical protein